MGLGLEKILRKLNKEEYIIVYEDDSYIVIFPNSEKAAAYLSYDTIWATNGGFHSLNANRRSIKNSFNGLYNFILFIKEHEDVKFLFDFKNGCIYDRQGYAINFILSYSYSFIERTLNSVISFLFKKYVEKGSKGNLNLSKMPLGDVKELHGITTVGGHLHLDNCPIYSLGDLKKVEGNLNIRNTNITNFGNLEYVGGLLAIDSFLLDKLNTIKHIGRNIHFYTEINCSDNYEEKIIELLETKYPQFKGKFILWCD